MKILQLVVISYLILIMEITTAIFRTKMYTHNIFWIAMLNDVYASTLVTNKDISGSTVQKSPTLLFHIFLLIIVEILGGSSPCVFATINVFIVRATWLYLVVSSFTKIDVRRCPLIAVSI